MTGALMALNPKRRRKRRKLTAKQALYFGKGRKRRSRTRAAARSGRRRSRKASVIIVSKNPRRASMSKRRRRRSRKYLSNPVRRRFRRNPRSGMNLGAIGYGVGGFVVTPMVSPYVTQLLGSVMPMSLNSDAIAQGISALGLGYAGKKLAGASAGKAIMVGGLVSAAMSFLGMANPLSGVLGGGLTGGIGMNRYMGYIRRINANRQMRGLAPLSPANFNRLRGLGGLSANPLNIQPGLGATAPSAFTKFRMMRNGGASGRLGYTGPARTLGRYAAR